VGQEYWHEDGRKLKWKEWFFFLSNDYFPRQIHGDMIRTEDDWRRALSHFEAEFDNGPAEKAQAEKMAKSAAE
jgi:hypothetical protein